MSFSYSVKCCEACYYATSFPTQCNRNGSPRFGTFVKPLDNCDYFRTAVYSENGVSCFLPVTDLKAFCKLWDAKQDLVLRLTPEDSALLTDFVSVNLKAPLVLDSSSGKQGILVVLTFPVTQAIEKFLLTCAAQDGVLNLALLQYVYWAYDRLLLAPGDSLVSPEASSSTSPSTSPSTD